MPKINLVKGNTLNKLKEGDVRKQLKEGKCPEHTQGIGHTLKQTQERGDVLNILKDVGIA